jgi:hypothetical protein
VWSRHESQPDAAIRWNRDDTILECHVVFSERRGYFPIGAIAATPGRASAYEEMSRRFAPAEV